MTVHSGLSLAMHMYVRRVGARFIHFFNGLQEFRLKEATGSFNIAFLGGVGNMGTHPTGPPVHSQSVTWAAATRVYRFYINGAQVKNGDHGEQRTLTF
jgi:hypothetical protein